MRNRNSVFFRSYISKTKGTGKEYPHLSLSLDTVFKKIKNDGKF
jgi:hypothetical protein